MAPGGGPSAEDLFEEANAATHKSEKVMAALNSIRSFTASASDLNRTIVLVTSGGTSVPLEKNTVRSVENFSTGKRGAASAEYFLKLGYMVIFLYRSGTACPFARHFQEELSDHLDLQFLDGLRVREKARALVVHGSGPGAVSKLSNHVKTYRQTQEHGTLLAVAYETVTDYLYMLHGAALLLAPFRQNAVFYLAAAVSDFFIPPSEMEVHKIQSASHDGLELRLKNVPKCLGLLRRQWAPDAFVVSFKLETDPDMLTKKARGAIERYGVHMVVANLLQTRYKEVQLVKESGPVRVSLDEALSTDLEASFVPMVAEAHYDHIASSGRPYGVPPPPRPLPKLSRTQRIVRRLRQMDVASLCLMVMLGPGVVLATTAMQKKIMKRLRE